MFGVWSEEHGVHGEQEDGRRMGGRWGKLEGRIEPGVMVGWEMGGLEWERFGWNMTYRRGGSYLMMRS